MATELVAAAGPTTTEQEQKQEQAPEFGQAVSPSPVLAVVVVRTGSHPGVRRPRPAAVFEAVEAQTCRPTRVVVVEVRTGTARGGPVPAPRSCAGHPDVLVVDGPATFASAVAEAVRAAGPLAPDEFVWMLRDDVVPAPDALERLVSYAGLDPSAAVFGSKVVDADAVVVEAGVSVDAAGRRATGVVPGERDRGRHDAVRDVLAVGLAGTLVRARMWTCLDGLGVAAAGDVEFGWLACAAGTRVVVVPAATVVTTRSAPRRAAGDRAFRVGALRLRLGFAAPWALLAVWLAIVLGGMRRAGCELVRGRPSRAADEATLTFEVAFRLVPVRQVRRRFAAVRQVPRRTLAPLFPGRFGNWDDLRRPLGRVALHRRDATFRHAEGVRRPGVNRPIWIVAAALVALGLVAGLLTPGPGLAAHSWELPWPAGARQLWAAVLASWQPAGAGLGGDGPAPAWLVFVALAATATGGRPELAADLLLLAGPPLAAVSCHGALSGSRALTATAGARRGLVLVAAACHALSPAMAFAVHRGRIDVVLALVALPLAVAAAAQVLGQADQARGGGRASTARLALALAFLVAAVTPLLVVAALALVAAVTTMVPARRRRARARPVAVALLAATIPLWPSWRQVLDDPSTVLTGGEPLSWPPASGAASGAGAASEIMIGEVGVAVTAVFGVPLAVAALVGVVAYRSRPAVVGGCLLFAAATVTSVAVAAAAAPSTTVGARAATAGAAVAGLLLAAVVAADRTPQTLRSRPFGWRQPAAAALAVSFGVAPGFLAASFVSDNGWRSPVPASAGGGELARLGTLARSCPPGSRLLVLSADGVGGAAAVRYTLASADGPRFGDAAGRPPPAARRFLAAAVTDLYAGGGRFTSSLAVLGACGAVVPAATASRGLVARLDAAPGLVRQAYRPGLLVWRPADSLGATLAHTVVYAGATAQAASSARIPPGEPSADAPRLADLLADVLAEQPPLGKAVARSGRLPAGGPDRIAVLTEPASRHWKATLDGVELPATTAWGWAQAFRLPADGGELEIKLDHQTHRRIVAGQVVAVVALAVVAATGAGAGRAGRGRRNRPRVGR